MTGLDQLIIGLTALILAVLGGLSVVAGTGLSSTISWMRLAPDLWDGILIGAVFILLAVYLLLIIARQKSEPAVVHQAELGAVRIGVSTIKGLINKKARDIDGVKDCAVTVVQTEPLLVRLDLQIQPDYNVPSLAEQLQQQVKEYLAETMGIEVAGVEILVRGIGETARPVGILSWGEFFLSRRVARQVAFQTLFQIDVGNCDVEEALQQRLADAVLDEANEQYVNEVVRGVYAYRAALDAQINDVSTGWRADRIGAVERSILRLAIYEIVFRDDVPVPVSVNEAVELAKRFGDDDAPRFINGVLGTVVRDGGFA